MLWKSQALDKHANNSISLGPGTDTCPWNGTQKADFEVQASGCFHIAQQGSKS